MPPAAQKSHRNFPKVQDLDDFGTIAHICCNDVAVISTPDSYSQYRQEYELILVGNIAAASRATSRPLTMERKESHSTGETLQLRAPKTAQPTRRSPGR